MLKAISLFTGVGGLDFGFEAAGFRTAVAVEMDAVSCRTIALNRDWPIIEDDIHRVDSRVILRKADLRPSEPDLLVGGPPCQPFSKSGYWKSGDAGRLDDPRAGTLVAFLRVLRDVRPRAFLLENVHGLAFRGKDEGLQFLLNGIHEVNRQAKTNYKVFWQTLNAAQYGVPQLRERVFLVGSRDGRPFIFPPATHWDLSDGFQFTNTELLPYKTAWDALGDLPAPSEDESLKVGGFWADLLPSIPEGQNYLHHTPRGAGKPLFGWRTRYWSFLLKLAKRRPSWTIQAQPGPAIGPFHWSNRKLSVAELCRLQTFPDGLTFDCSRNEVQRLLGNAVPSLMTEILAREIRAQFFDLRRTPGLKLMPRAQPETPGPERVKPVPKKYLELQGDHAEHPGEGKGVGAKKRQGGARPRTEPALVE